MSDTEAKAILAALNRVRREREEQPPADTPPETTELPRLHVGQQCPDCLHPWWAHETRAPSGPLASWQVPLRCCIGQECRCTRLGPASGGAR
jgi:hypothetical protein